MKLITYKENPNTYNTYAKEEDIPGALETIPYNFKPFMKLTIDERSKYLYTATKKIDIEYRYKNEKLRNNQSCEFPRVGFSDVPMDITLATILKACEMLKGEEEERLKFEKIGKTIVEERFRDYEILDKPKPIYYFLLKPFICQHVYMLRG